MKINLVLLASGNSKRFGSNKLLYKINGKEMFKYSVDLADDLKKSLKDTIKNIIVVSKYQEIKEYVLSKNMIYVENPQSELGISTSIILGISESEKSESDYIMFMVCDQPYTKSFTIKSFIESFLKSSKGIGAVAFEKIMGNPCIFSWKYLEDLKKLSGDIGGKKIIKENLDDVYIYEVSTKKELEDIDFLNKNA